MPNINPQMPSSQVLTDSDLLEGSSSAIHNRSRNTHATRQIWRSGTHDQLKMVNFGLQTLYQVAACIYSQAGIKQPANRIFA